MTDTPEGWTQQDAGPGWRLWLRGSAVYVDPMPADSLLGRWKATVFGPTGTLIFGSFPRYYMEEEVAKSEMKAWLYWYMSCEKDGNV